MRWIIVFLLLYLIPLVEIFRNYKNLKRACLYSSIYTVLITTIVISNMYMSGLGKIKEAMYNQEYVYSNYLQHNNGKGELQDTVKSKDNEKKLKLSEDISKKEKDPKQLPESNKEDKLFESKDKVERKEVNDATKQEVTDESKENLVVSDKKIVEDFKEEVFEIEKIALIPMRECVPYTKNIAKSITKLSKIREDIENARNKCDEVVKKYKDMSIKEMSKPEYTKVLSVCKDDLIKTYEKRKEAMEFAIELVDSKNPKYISKITQPLYSSDKNIADFKERIASLIEDINK